MSKSSPQVLPNQLTAQKGANAIGKPINTFSPGFTTFDIESNVDPAKGQTLGDHLNISIRHGFIRKVYGLLSIQLVLTTLVGYAVSLKAASIQKSPGLFVLAVLLNFGLLIAMMCIPSLLRKYPRNYIILGLFTLTQGFLVGVLSSRYSAELVLTAAGCTALVVGGLSLFALQTKYDFTGKGSYLFAAGLALLCCSFIGIFFRQMPWMRVAIACGFLLLFCLYLVYDTQLIVGGKDRQYELGIDEYCFGALILYIDIIQIYQIILQLLGDFDR